MSVARQLLALHIQANTLNIIIQYLVKINQHYKNTDMNSSEKDARSHCHTLLVVVVYFAGAILCEAEHLFEHQNKVGCSRQILFNPASLQGF